MSTSSKSVEDWVETVSLQREADAALVEAAGCRCGAELARAEARQTDYSFAEAFGGPAYVEYKKQQDETRSRRECEPWCPLALATQIRSGG